MGSAAQNGCLTTAPLLQDSKKMLRCIARRDHGTLLFDQGAFNLGTALSEVPKPSSRLKLSLTVFHTSWHSMAGFSSFTLGLQRLFLLMFLDRKREMPNAGAPGIILLHLVALSKKKIPLMFPMISGRVGISPCGGQPHGIVSYSTPLSTRRTGAMGRNSQSPQSKGSL